MTDAISSVVCDGRTYPILKVQHPFVSKDITFVEDQIFANFIEVGTGLDPGHRPTALYDVAADLHVLHVDAVFLVERSNVFRARRGLV